MNAIQIVDLDEDTLRRLAERAKADGLSIEKEAAQLLRKQLHDRDELVDRAKRIRAMTPAGVAQSDSVKLIREARDAR